MGLEAENSPAWGTRGSLPSYRHPCELDLCGWLRPLLSPASTPPPRSPPQAVSQLTGMSTPFLEGRLFWPVAKEKG